MAKAISMLRIRNSRYIAFAPANDMAEAKRIRKAEPTLKHSRIEDCLQCLPDKVQYGVVYDSHKS